MMLPPSFFHCAIPVLSILTRLFGFSPLPFLGSSSKHLQTLDHFGTLDVIINNAGYGGKHLVDEIQDETDEWIESLNANYVGAMQLIRLAMSYWAKNRKQGVVINSGSTASFGLHMDLSYSVAKSGLNFATQSITGKNASKRAFRPQKSNTK